MKIFYADCNKQMEAPGIIQSLPSYCCTVNSWIHSTVTNSNNQNSFANKTIGKWIFVVHCMNDLPLKERKFITWMHFYIWHI